MITVATQIPGLDTAKKLQRFLTYPNGWHFGQGVPPTLNRVKGALILNNAAAKAQLRTNAFLGTDGEVRVTVYRKDIYLQFTLEDDDLVEYIREEREVEIARTPRLRLVDALSILETFENELCLTSVSSTATTTIRTRDTSKTLPSKPPDADWGFLWSSGTALPA